MKLNPEEYDPDELRRMAEERMDREGDGRGNGTGGTAGTGAFTFGNAVEGGGRRADALRTNQLEQLFLHQSAMSDDDLSKPYLGELPQKYAAERVVFDWLEFLVLKAGFKRAMEALRYYRTIDWITPAVESDLQDYLVGFSGDVEASGELDVEDHQLSLVYLARLASMHG